MKRRRLVWLGYFLAPAVLLVADQAVSQQTQVPATPNHASSCERWERRGDGFVKIGVCYAKTGQIQGSHDETRRACEARMRCGIIDPDCWKGLDACIGINNPRCDQGTPMERGACRTPKDTCAHAPNGEERDRCMDIARVWSEATALQSSAPAVPATPNHAGDCDRFPHNREGRVMQGICNAKIGVISGNRDQVKQQCESRMACGLIDPDCYLGAEICRGIVDPACNDGTMHAKNGACRAPRGPCAGAPFPEEAGMCQEVARAWSEGSRAASGPSIPPRTGNQAGGCDRFPHNHLGNIQQGICYAKSGFVPFANNRSERELPKRACDGLIACPGRNDLGECNLARNICKGAANSACDDTAYDAHDASIGGLFVGGHEMRNGACRAWQASCDTAPNPRERGFCVETQRAWAEATRPGPRALTAEQCDRFGPGMDNNHRRGVCVGSLVLTPPNDPRDIHGLCSAAIRGCVLDDCYAAIDACKGVMWARRAHACNSTDVIPEGVAAGGYGLTGLPHTSERRFASCQAALYGTCHTSGKPVEMESCRLALAAMHEQSIAPVEPLGPELTHPALPDVYTYTGRPSATAPLLNADFEVNTNPGWTRGSMACEQTAPASSLRPGGRAVTDLGGDYWQIPFPSGVDIGNQGSCWWKVDSGEAVSPLVRPTQSAVTFLARGNGRIEVRTVQGAVVGHVAIANSGIMQRDAISFASLRADQRQSGINIVAVGEGAGIEIDDVRFTNDTGWFDRGGRTTPVPPIPAKPTVFGFADLHTHLLGHMGHGGMMLWGDPIRPMSEGLKACDWGHRSAAQVWGAGGVWSGVLPFIATAATTGRLALAIDGTEKGIGMAGGHPSGGWPDFDGWPRFHTMLHQQAHVDWLRRAWRGGMRLMVAQAGSNEVFARLFGSMGDADDQRVGRRLIDGIHNFVADRRAADFMELAKTPEQARDIIGRGKMAVVIGLEVDSIANCSKDAPGTYPLSIDGSRSYTCNWQNVKAELDWLYDNDVRHIFLVAHADNAFGGTAVYNSSFDVLELFKRGDTFTYDPNVDKSILKRIRNGHGQGAMTFFGDALMGLNMPIYPASQAIGRQDIIAGGHHNIRSLTPFGEQTLRYALQKGFIVESDHMSQNMAREALRVAQGRRQPLVGGHQGIRDLQFLPHEAADPNKWKGESDKGYEDLRRVGELGGMIGTATNQGDVRTAPGSHVTTECPGSSWSNVQAYTYITQVMGGRSVAFGSDINGFNGQSQPRFGPFGCMARKVELGWGDNDFRRYRPNLGALASKDEGANFSTRQDLQAQRFAVAYKTGIERAGGWFWRRLLRSEAYTMGERDAWEAILIVESGVDPAIARSKMPITSGQGRMLHQVECIMNFVRGLRENVPDRPEAGLPGNFWDERRAAFLVRTGARLTGGESSSLQQRISDVKVAWERWREIKDRPGNAGAPMEKSVAGNRDFDINIDGVAHIGLFPDLLQDMHNQMAHTPVPASSPVHPSKQVKNVHALLRGANDYIMMWERVNAGR